MKVGWIGLGQMGEPMALRVLAAGHEVIGYVRPGRSRERLTAAGARLTGVLSEAVRDAEVVVVSLYDDVQLREILLAQGGLAALAPGAALAVHTTGVPAVMETLAAAAGPGVQLLDATFSGTAADAEARRIRLFLGGTEAAIERARPVLAAYCDPMIRVGSIGAARRLKLINNFLFAAQISLAAEALRALDQMGIDPQTALRALRVSSGSSFALDQFARGSVDQVLAGLGRYLDKDVDAARQAAAAEGLDVPLLSAAARWGTER